MVVDEDGTLVVVVVTTDVPREPDRLDSPVIVVEHEVRVTIRHTHSVSHLTTTTLDQTSSSRMLRSLPTHPC